MSLDSNAEREAFELWANSQDMYMSRSAINGEYHGEATKAAFRAWLARSQPSEWVATKARQPDEHEAVLAFHPDWGVDVCMRENGWPLQIGANMEYATHWMELPKPPALLPPNTEAK